MPELWRLLHTRAVTDDDERAGALRLRPPHHPVDRRAVGWWATQLGLAVAAVVVPLLVLGALITPARFWLWLPAALIGVPGLAATIALPLLWFRHHRWEITDEAVYTRTGWFFTQWRVAPLSRVQTVDTIRGPLEQRFGVATLTVTTASSKGAVKVEGLAATVAADLAQELTRTVQASPGDAT